MASAALGVVAELGGHFREALEIVDEGVRSADASVDRKGHRYPHYLDRGRILLELDRSDDARAALETGMRVSEQLGLPWQLSAYQTILAVERFVAGAWDDAIDAFEVGQRLAAEHSAAHDTLVLGHSMRCLIALHRNDLSLAEQAACAATREYDDSYIRYRAHWAAWVRALLLEADGAVPDAYATLAACWDRCAESGLAVEYPALGPDLVRLALAVDEPERAADVTDAVAAVAGINDVPSLTGAALRCQGLRDDDPDALLRAVDAYERSPRPLELALAREEAGTVLATNGDADTAVSLLGEALNGYERLDAERDVARTRAALRELGVHRGERGKRDRPRTGWASLTPTERMVSDLVAEGLSNPQIGERLFVSRRTVQTHLAHVFRKLQMSSRSELAAEVARRREAT